MKRFVKLLYVLMCLIICGFTFRGYSVQATTTDNYLKKSMYYHMKSMDEEFKFIYDGDIDSAMNMIDEASKYGNDTYLNVTNCRLEQYGNEYTAKMTYYVNKSKDSYVNSILKEVIDSNVTSDMTTYEKVEFVNKYLIKRLEYDKTMTSYDPYTALTTGKTVCQGYSMLAAKMYDMMDIENEIAIGSLENDAHGWNRVKIGQYWYNVDTTNCDALRDEECLFLKSDQKLRENGFSWDADSVTAPAQYDYKDVSHDNDEIYKTSITKVQNPNSWYKKNGWWFYRDLEGNNATGWLYYSGTWYYLDEYGRMKTGWLKYNGQWYYLASNGARQTGKKYIDGKWYYLDEIGELIS